MPRRKNAYRPPAQVQESIVAALTFAQVRQITSDNVRNGRDVFSGLSSDDVATYHRGCMFCENDEAFPDAAEWSRIVD